MVLVVRAVAVGVLIGTLLGCSGEMFSEPRDRFCLGVDIGVLAVGDPPGFERILALAAGDTRQSVERDREGDTSRSSAKLVRLYGQEFVDGAPAGSRQETVEVSEAVSAARNGELTTAEAEQAAAAFARIAEGADESCPGWAHSQDY